MLDELRLAAARQRANHLLRSLVVGCKRLLSERGETNSMAIARQLVERIDMLPEEQLGGFFDYLAQQLGPDPQQVLRAAQAYADRPDAQRQIALTQAAEPPRQELLRRLNRTPGGTGMLVRMRRALLHRLPRQPELMGLEADLLHLFSSWFNPGFLQMRRVDWNSPAKLLEKIIHHEAVHAIDGWDDLRRRLQPDRRCFAFFHPQLPDEPLIFVEVALLPEMPQAIAPLIDKASTPLAAGALPRRRVLQHQQLRAGAAQRVAGQLPDQERGRAAAARAAAHPQLLHAVAGAGFRRLAAGRTGLRRAAAPAPQRRRRLRRRTRAPARTLRWRPGRAAARGHARQAGQGIAGRAADAVLGLPAASVAHARGRPGGALPPGQRRAPGAAECAWQHVAQGR